MEAQRSRKSQAVSAPARYRTAAQRLMIGALPAVSGGKARGRPELSL